MCGRYTLTPSLATLLEHYALQDEIASYTARYNIAPSQDVPVVRLSDEPLHRILTFMHWGLIPHWAKEKKTNYSMINAVGETLAQKPSFRVPFKKRRCLIPASGYYEWMPTGAKTKQPYYIKIPNQEVFSFAGLWEHWEGGDKVIESCTIITTTANEATKQIHGRMPVILDPDDYDLWLNLDTPQETLQKLLIPYTCHPMTLFPVSTRVNSPKNAGPECIAPLH